mmetsp:Transcript_38033/g.88298  ORF Transcript_38033/g.88298 Transcript_38033/m.88298 type:complete len:109 (+) Transcript_38033:297-623(+)
MTVAATAALTSTTLNLEDGHGETGEGVLRICCAQRDLPVFIHKDVGDRPAGTHSENIQLLKVFEGFAHSQDAWKIVSAHCKEGRACAVDAVLTSRCLELRAKADRLVS